MTTSGLDWEKLAQRYNEIAEQLTSSSLDTTQRGALQKEFSHLAQILEKKRELDVLERERDAVELQQKENTDPEFALLFEEEIRDLDELLRAKERELETKLFPPDPLDEKSVFIEIRAGTGGQEAALFAADLMRMYLMYSLRKNWRASLMSESPTDLGGYREIIIHIQGKGVYGHLKFESGVHRVQRVPTTETGGRIHTSTATVAVFPEEEEDTGAATAINQADLRIDYYRAGGAGGQHVNKTDSAVRITHLPTGLVVACQDERSQHKNKAKAMKVLQARLNALQREKQEAEMSQKRREQVGTGMRAEKVRTYNYPQNRVTDHQVTITLSKLNMVMEGDLDDIIQELRDYDQRQRRERGITR